LTEAVTNKHTKTDQSGEGAMYYGEIEGTGIEVRDKRFAACLIGHARVERLWTGARWAEGPAWFAAGRYLVFSDIPNNRMIRYDEATGHTGVFRHPASFSNGNTVDRQGRLVTCEHLTRRVTRTEHDGSLTVIADRIDGKRFNSPNDVVVKSDGSIWFTDPDYGIGTDYEGDKATSEIGANRVYRVDPSGTVTVVAEDFICPNGLAFDPEERYLYVADTGATHVENGPRHIRRLEVKETAQFGTGLGRSDIFATCEAGLFDGFRFDTAGRLWTSAGDGVHCYHPDGTLIGKVLIPEMVANVTFGGPKRNRLFICGTTSLYSYYTAVTGV
jgi:gluconolactonase